MRFTVQTQAGPRSLDIDIDRLVIAGWTGRDVQAMEHHIQELEALGIPRPARTPMFYRVAAARLGVFDSVQSPGEASSGEVEFMLLRHAGRVYVGVASDHTDREVEAYSVTVSKQMCDKPCADTLWPLEEVHAHWDRLLLHSWIREHGRMTRYQSGPATTMLDPAALLEDMAGFEPFENGTAVLGGTLAAIGGVRPSERFEFELEDPLLKRSIRGGYDIVPLPLRG
ncbi:hypothetical protein PIGHUM_03170 [Pigmentiphaga humi]|uniref:DUF2848 domain-containing protein n=1 Tax=Pigmentiphaga humi TaxID=2478468 RepID=A0A3P4B648_9BURK|nr:DUF2848 domain-containing protein [Pigmentiphaga humi]VCU71090.1 hypothetical protein PIGHUM_03170 [Pigmentiphaga humi]